MDLSNFLVESDLTEVGLLAVIAVALIFIVGWCFFDVCWRVFLHRVKLAVFLLVPFVLLGDWEADVSLIEDNIRTIKGKVDSISSGFGLINDNVHDFYYSLY